MWRRNIDEALGRNCVSVVLLTPELLASGFIADVELPQLLRVARAGDVTLGAVPIERHVEGSTRFADGDLESFQWPWEPEKLIAELEARRRRTLTTVVNAAGQRREPCPACRHRRCSQTDLAAPC